MLFSVIKDNLSKANTHTHTHTHTHTRRSPGLGNEVLNVGWGVPPLTRDANLNVIPKFLEHLGFLI